MATMLVGVYITGYYFSGGGDVSSNFGDGVFSDGGDGVLSEVGDRIW